ncbi:MAG: hypothetical protein ACRDRU_13075 [Pseudonocardiaceae bacterium]
MRLLCGVIVTLGLRVGGIGESRGDVSHGQLGWRAVEHHQLPTWRDRWIVRGGFWSRRWPGTTEKCEVANDLADRDAQPKRVEGVQVQRAGSGAVQPYPPQAHPHTQVGAMAVPVQAGDGPQIGIPLPAQSGQEPDLPIMAAHCLPLAP